MHKSWKAVESCCQKTMHKSWKVVESRCQKRYTCREKPLPKTVHKSWKVVESRCQKRCTSRGKLLPKTMHKSWKAVESRCQKRCTCRGKPLPKTIHMPWKAATKNDAQAVKSCCPNRWYKVVKEQWIATNLIMISPMHNEPATHFSVEVRGWFVFKARRSTFQNARGADRLLSMPQSGAQGV